MLLPTKPHWIIIIVIEEGGGRNTKHTRQKNENRNLRGVNSSRNELLDCRMASSLWVLLSFPPSSLFRFTHTQGERDRDRDTLATMTYPTTSWASAAAAQAGCAPMIIDGSATSATAHAAMRTMRPAVSHDGAAASNR